MYTTACDGNSSTLPVPDRYNKSDPEKGTYEEKVVAFSGTPLRGEC